MRIKLFGGLRRHAGGSEVAVSGGTVRELLNELSRMNEPLGEAIINADGSLRPHVRVMVNGIDSELVQGLDTPVSESDQIAIFPPIAGG